MRLISVPRGTARSEGVEGASEPMERRLTSAIWKEPAAGAAGPDKLWVIRRGLVRR